jgi:hemerythrin-like domain-containing protein
MFPRAFLVEKARDVIHGFRRHMTTEEERIFPLAREILSAEELEGIAFRNGGALADDEEEEEQRFDTLYRTIGRQVEIGLGASGT